MSLTKSSLYSERIYAEHPLAMWSLDDDISYKNMLVSFALDTPSNWAVVNLVHAFEQSNATAPIPDSPVLSFTRQSAGSARFESLFTLDSELDFNYSLGTGCVSAYVYSEQAGTVFRIGAGHSTESNSEFVTEAGWNFISHTFSLPVSDSIAFFVETPSSPALIQVNGFSVGQHNESFASTTIGFTDVDASILDSGVLSGTSNTLVYADAYGVDPENTGYYIVSSGSAYCKPSGIPIVYGSSQSLAVLEAPNSNPSIVLPGNGFLNQSGINNNYTLEFWARLYNESIDPVRIVGPVFSTDGIYLEEGFISVYVGPYTKSYFIGRFDRPMLVNMQYSPTRVALMINGDQVISLDIDIANIDFPALESGAESLDWIGVYGNSYVSPFEIDAISIFPYLLPPEVAKKHFVYGQGVEELDFTVPMLRKSTVQFDFPYSEYAYNVIYPDTMKWRSGVSINMNSTSSYLGTSEYSLPDILVKNGFESTSEDDWFLDNRALNDAEADFFPYVKMIPSGNFTDASIYFDKASVLDSRVESIIGVFKSPETSQNGVVMRFKNKSVGDSIVIRLNGTTLSYSYIDANAVSTVLHSETVVDNSYFAVGIDISSLSSDFYSTIGNFFSNMDRISLSIGGTGEDDAFAGKMYAVHFVNRHFFVKDLSTLFAAPFVSQSGILDLIKYIGNYTLLPTQKNVTMGFDIGAAGYWEDVIPLSMFGKTVISASSSFYDLDMIQFNIDAPYKQGIIVPPVTPTYGLFTQYLGLSNKTYGYADTLGFTSYADALNDFNSNVGDLRYSTSMNSYITIQHFSDAGGKSFADFVNTEPAGSTRVIYPLSADFSDTKYEIFDNYVIMIPEDIDFNQYYMGIHIEMRVRGTQQKNMAIKRLELASVAFNQGIPTKIGTKHSVPVYPQPVGAT